MKINEKSIEFADTLDCDGEMEMEIAGRGEGGCNIYLWISQDEAMAIIAHLEKVFGVKR